MAGLASYWSGYYPVLLVQLAGWDQAPPPACLAQLAHTFCAVHRLVADPAV